ncbi:MAG TPA: ribonuclease E/G [Allosphingosinicella sp.]|nr:ribonuclease E/G [Allosphingosinicella sp.]
MTMRMLIDARHQEETRVAVVKGNRIEEFDFESAEHKQLKGNIYLAKVTRVEPSLQAAFVDYGGNRHGFLAFSEIHPDYYQIPREDREALLREEAEHAAEEERLRAAEDARYEDRDDEEEDHGRGFIDSGNQNGFVESDGESEEGDEDAPAPPESAESAPEENAADELRRKRQNLRRRYKIQDVIRRRQVLLVQVVKEERGNKGAALTTYLSLAGRYCVLMPNTSHGGGISRKISNGADRKRLKQIMSDLSLPNSMSCIVRTAGLSRTKVEIKRDFDYLARLWDEIRERTLKSSAPALIYGDSDLIKRAIRDIYNRDIDEVIVEGEDGYKAARAFMKLLMPSHVKRVANYVDTVPLFQRYGAEDQLAAMYQPVVQLKSGGYLVINPTEALVSIDINSGRSTREHNIEQTAYATNIEAANEIARQLRLRDMAGLVVIDFIDMESNGHIRKVEKAMKEALKNDRARIQVGRISSFGLMEMSRQRLRTGVLEASTRPCPHCEGTGLMRTASSAGLSALRMLEEEAARGRGSRIVLRAGREAAVYVLNRKRGEIGEIESRYGVVIEVLIEETFEGAKMAVESFGPPPAARPRVERIVEPELDEEEFAEDLADEIEESGEAEEDEEEEARPRRSENREQRERREESEERGRKRRRRRGRRGGRRREGEEGEQGPAEPSSEPDSAPAVAEVPGEAEPQYAPVAESVDPVEPAPDAPAEAEEKPKGRRRPRARRKEEAPVEPAPQPEAAEAPAPAAEPEPAPVAEAASEEEKPAKPKRTRRKKAAEAEAPAEAPAPEAANDTEGAAEEQAGPAEPAEAGEPRRGWWQRTFGA